MSLDPEDRVFGDWRDYLVAFIGGGLPWQWHVAVIAVVVGLLMLAAWLGGGS